MDIIIKLTLCDFFESCNVQNIIGCWRGGYLDSWSQGRFILYSNFLQPDDLIFFQIELRNTYFGMFKIVFY